MILSLAAALVLASPQTWTLDASRSQVSYQLVHKLHQFTGTDHRLQGRARVLPDGTVQVEIRGQVKDFDSGNSNRDEHMLETVEAEKFPEVLVRALMKGLVASGTRDGTARVEAKLHGVKQTEDAPLTVSFPTPGAAHVTGVFNESVEGFGIKRPTLLFIPINDAMKITVDIWFNRDGA